MNKNIAIAFLIATLLTMTQPTNAAPPATERQDFSYGLHGVTIDDPYHWLEGSDSPNAPDDGTAPDAAVSE